MKPVLFFLLSLLCFAVSADTKVLKTTGELSHFQKTGRYIEVERLCKAFATKFPDQVDCITFGTTPEGRKMRALVLADSKKGLLAFWNKKQKRPVIYFQGGIHAGEIDGKDAGFWLVRQILEKEANPKLLEALKKVTLVFVPVFNVDGHERFGKNNRPNQIGPEEMGWRTTSQNYNLNRDYLKAESPEMQALIKLLDTWDPVVGLDLHVTDGAQFQHDIAIVTEPSFQGPPELREAAKEVEASLLASLKAQGHLPLGFYPAFKKPDNPASGVSLYVSPPRYSQGYLAIRNRMGILVETHSWKDYAARVKATRDILEDVIILAAQKGSQWRKLINEVDSRFSNSVGQTVNLSFEATDKHQEIEFLGYKYSREESEVSGGMVPTYFPNQPEVWKIPLYSELVPKVSANIPEGYVVPKPFASIVVPKLKAHGIKYTEISDDVGDKELGLFRSDNFTFAQKPFEGHQNLNVAGEWKKEHVTINPGDIFVTTRQPKAQVVLHLLEPKAPDSLLFWGFFNNRFEPKELLEDYVAEGIAKELLANPEIKKTFEEKLDDSDFENSTEKRIEFFHKLHPSADKVLGLYPVYRADKKLK